MLLLCLPHPSVHAQLSAFTLVVVCLCSGVVLCQENKDNKLSTRHQASIESLYNSLRGNVKNAADMIRMAWNDDLMDSAIEWVKHCDYGRAKPTVQGMNESSIRIYVYSDTSKPERDAYNKWFATTRRYFSLTPRCRGGNDCQEYRTMLLSKSTSMGCAFSRCDSLKSYSKSRKGYMYVCLQGPGMPVGKREMPYKEGAYCSKCPLKYSNCVRKLCSGHRIRFAEASGTQGQPTPSNPVTMVTIMFAAGLSYILVA